MSTTFTAFTAGQQFLWHDRVVELDCVVSATAASVRDIASGCLRTVPLEELRPVTPPADKGVEEDSYVPQKQWDEAKRRYRELVPFVERGTLSQADASRVVRVLNLGERQVRRNFRRLRSFLTVRGLVTRKPGPQGRGRKYLKPEQEKAVQEILDQHFLVADPKSIPDLMDDLRALCAKRGCPTPSIRTVYRRVACLDPGRTLRKQRGAKAAAQRFAARPKSLMVSEALEVLQVDHTLVDLILVSADRFRTYLGRPWLTVAIDIATRCILGFYLSFDAPSAVSVGACLAHATLPKGPWLESIGLTGVKWPMYGKTQRLHTDNGKDFWALALQRGCADLGIESVFRPVGRPHWGGHVERVIGTLMRRVHSLPGTTFSNVARRGDYPSEKRAVFTLAEFREWLVYEIVRYHARPHKGLGGMTPHQAWLKARTNADGIYQPPPIVASPNEFLLRFLPAVPRKVRRAGVEFEGLRYWHDDIAKFIGSNQKHDLYYDPRDISRTYMRGSDGHWVELAPINRPLEPISHYEFRAYKARCRAECRDPQADDARAQTAEKQQALVSGASRRTRQARGAAQRETTRLSLVKETAPRRPVASPQTEPPPARVDDEDESLETPPVARWDD